MSPDESRKRERERESAYDTPVGITLLAHHWTFSARTHFLQDDPLEGALLSDIGSRERNAHPAPLN
jgi:hypothetical protein